MTQEQAKNCTSGWACPNCGNNGTDEDKPFLVRATGTAELTDTGLVFTNSGESGIKDGSYVVCSACNYRGKTDEFDDRSGCMASID